MINNDGSDSKTSGGKKGVRWQREGRPLAAGIKHQGGGEVRVSLIKNGRGPGKTSTWGCEASRTICQREEWEEERRQAVGQSFQNRRIGST